MAQVLPIYLFTLLLLLNIYFIFFEMVARQGFPQYCTIFLLVILNSRLFLGHSNRLQSSVQRAGYYLKVNKQIFNSIQLFTNKNN